MKIKIKALKAYKSQIKKHPFPRSISSIKSLALFKVQVVASNTQKVLKH